jgi:hypothetical protein
LVYSYTEEGKLTIKKVRKVFDNGVRNCVELKWQSSGDRSTGSLIITPDHKVKTKYKGWQKVENLKRYDKLYHLRRSPQSKNEENSRIRLYGTNSYMELEESCIKREFFGAKSSLHIHHKDENPSNNEISNLEILTAKEHMRKHMSQQGRVAIVMENLKKAWDNRPAPRYGEHSYAWKKFSKYSLLKKLAKAKGRPTYVDLDFETFLRKCKLHDIDVTEVGKRYSKKGIYLNRARILKAFTEDSRTLETSKSLGIGTPRLKKLCAKYDLPYNHAVTSVRPYGERRVFDLEVEDTHNYIAGEICVHNCREPNIQNITDKDIKIAGVKYPLSLREAFDYPKGYKGALLDYSQIELRFLAEMSNDPVMIKVFQDGKDLHSFAGSKRVWLYEDKPKNLKENERISYEEFERIRANEEHPRRSEMESARKKSKAVNFGIAYGIGSQGLAKGLKCSEIEAQEWIDNFAETYKVAWEFLQKQGNKAVTTLEARSMWGRRQTFEKPKENYQKGAISRNGRNMPIQSSAADLMKRALKLIQDAINHYDACIVSIVHDEVTIECKEEEAEMILTIAKKCMEDAGREFLKKVPVKADGKVVDCWSEK